MNSIQNLSKINYQTQSYFFHLPIIALAALVAFWKIPSFSFLIGWDDQWFVTNHYTEEGFTIRNIWAILSDFYSGQYAPVNQFYYTLMYQIFKYNTLYYHLIQAILHLLNTVLIYKLIEKISGQFESIPLKCSQIAFISALLFAVSPFNLEPVAWVAANKVILYALFYLSALHSYIAYITTNKPKHFYLLVLYLILSFGSKEQAVTFPLCMVLIDYVYKRDFQDKTIWFEKLPILVLCLLFGLATLESQGLEGAENTQFYPVYQRIILSFYTVTEYLVKTIAPVNISYLYPFPFQVGESMPVWLWIYPFAFIIILVCLFRILKKKWILFGLLFFGIHIVLVVNIFSLARYSVVADRYAYVSSIGLYFIIGYLLVKYSSINKFKKRSLTVAGLYVMYFIIYTNVHSSVWKNAITLKEKIRNVVEKRGDFKAWEAKRNKL